MTGAAYRLHLRMQAPPQPTARCANGRCGSERVQLCRIAGLREPRHLCAACRFALRALYVIEGVA